MKHILLSLLLLTSVAAFAQNSEHFYHNIDLRIVCINDLCEYSEKITISKPVGTNIVLFETINLIPKLYMYIDTSVDNIKLSPKWIYSHKIGNKVHFEYLAKSRFFSIK